MFSEKFIEIANKAGINIDSMINRCDDLESRHKDTDKKDVNTSVNWLEDIAETLSSKEISFLLMAAMSPNDAMAEDDIEAYLKEQGFTKTSDGKFIKSYENNEEMKEDTDRIGQELGAEGMVELVPTAEIKAIPYTPSEHSRNALGYDHTLEVIGDAIGIDLTELSTRLNEANVLLISKKYSERVEYLERNFTRKELSYAFDHKSRESRQITDRVEARIDEIKESLSPKIKPVRKPRTPKQK